MAFAVTNSKGNQYFLHGREQKLRNSDHVVQLYFFAKEVKPGALDAVPAGYVVSESKNGLPVLKKAVAA